MKVVGNLPKCQNVARHEYRDNIAVLSAKISSDEQGKFIGRAVETIAKNKKFIADQMKSQTPNEKLLAKARENIQISIDTIKTRATNLGASEDVVVDIINDVNNDDIEQVTLKVLKLMAKKNPGLNRSKYEMALRKFAEKQK